MKKTKRKNKGITLIALVITIIVLLILAGVTIASLSGDNGILTRAAEGKEKTNKANFDEKVTIVSTELKMGYETDTPVANPKIFLEGKFEEVIDNGDNSYTVKDNPYEAIIDVQGNKKNTVEVGKISTETQKNNYTDEEGNKATIPQGFTIVPGCETISKGLVISDDPNDIEANTEKIANGAQFVWIPVDNIDDMVGGMDKTDINARWGKLYSENDLNNSENGTDLAKPNNTGFREPDILEDSSYGDNTPENLNKIKEGYTIDKFENDLKLEFYNMSESVKKYGGFYVGRYESSFGIDKTNSYLAPIKGAESATGDNTSADTWYGLYGKQKLYKKGNIEGRMIWGCQYDAMLKCMQNFGVKDITTDSPIDIGKTSPAKINQKRITGNNKEDKLYNIYDLLGNSFECTLEANSTNDRIGRGGRSNCDFSLSPAYRSYGPPALASSRHSTRATLCIP